MARLEDLGKVISTDVLVIGGGVGGLVTAIKAKEECPDVDVLIVEKQTIGFAGKAAKTGGIICLLGPNDNSDEFIEWHIRKVGTYLNDQELLESYVGESYSSMEKLAEWGVSVAKDEQGKIAILTKSPYTPSNWSMTEVSLDMMLPLRARARKMGVKMLNKIAVVRLLKQGNQVVGAAGFNIIDGQFHIFKAKAAILAAGACSYKVKRFWSSASGEGIAAAYWAGADMRNAEFGNLYAHIVAKDTDRGHYESGRVVNALGESLLDKYVTEPGPWGFPVHPTFALGWENEVREGRGPIYADLTILLPPEASYRAKRVLPKTIEFRDRQQAKIDKYWRPDSLTKIELELALHAEQSCIKVDHEMKTSLAGLWAIGDSSYAGSALAGATPAPPGITQGCGLGFAFISAMWGGPSAARFAAKAALPEVNYAEVKELKEDMFAPMQRDKGLAPTDAIYAIQDAVCPMKYNMRRHEDRLEEALSKIKEVQRRLPDLWAKDTHYLGKCHEARSMAVCAEMVFRAALMRTESRGWHFREDYPKRDDKNWLKWVIIRQAEGKMILSTEPVPIDKYKIQP